MADPQQQVVAVAGRDQLQAYRPPVGGEAARDRQRGLLGPLLEWGSPDTVYLTYGKLWLPVFVAFTLCAFVVRQRRAPRGFEKWCWRVVLTAYVLACLSVAAEYWTQWGAMDDGLLDVVFLATMLGSSALGVVLLRGRLGFPALLLALAFPLVFVISAVTSLGNVVLPIAFAFGILGRRIARAEASPSPTTASHPALRS